ncbi:MULTISPECIES: hypothetical protein [Haloferacaceae]|uniref:Small CPxCG-related zinc finger protein n=1 Tax=Halorubrum glutamatedens TaxID=2707018 RepID=A0ABD5QTJ8_9EURY|nr:hypothetical protein [Halobellus captivus]
MSTTDLVQCGYCHRTIKRYARTPHGRRYCPDCGAIKAEDQR